VCQEGKEEAMVPHLNLSYLGVANQKTERAARSRQGTRGNRKGQNSQKHFARGQSGPLDWSPVPPVDRQIGSSDLVRLAGSVSKKQRRSSNLLRILR
jgi:hypothetical protein